MNNDYWHQRLIDAYGDCEDATDRILEKAMTAYFGSKDKDGLNDLERFAYDRIESRMESLTEGVWSDVYTLLTTNNSVIRNHG